MSLEIWTITKHPKDFPGLYVARKSVVAGAGAVRQTDEILADADPDKLREALADMGLVRLAPAADDYPIIVETWL